MKKYIPRYRGDYVGEDRAISNQEVYEMLDRIVSCESICGNEYECGLLIADIAREHDLTVEIQPVAERRENILITLGSDSYLTGIHGLLLHGHYDTVPFLDMPDPLNTRVKDNMLWGRGSVDQKGGLVACLCAAIAMNRLNRPFRRSLCVAAVVDEESEHRGSYRLAESKISADYAFVTEPTNTTSVEFGCRGTSPIRITVEGKTAHASTAWMGVNSIEKALPILNLLFKLEFPSLDLGELGIVRGTLCVSMINAGTAYNNVPFETEIWMDRRTVMGENSPMALAQIQQVIEEVREKDPSVKAHAEIARPDWSWKPIMERGLNPTLTEVSTELFDYLQDAADKSGVGKLQKTFSNGYNDMDFLVNDLGIPTLVYGPGNGPLSHSAAEEVDIDDVCRVTNVLCHVIERLCL